MQRRRYEKGNDIVWYGARPHLGMRQLPTAHRQWMYSEGYEAEYQGVLYKQHAVDELEWV